MSRIIKIRKNHIWLVIVVAIIMFFNMPATFLRPNVGGFFYLGLLIFIYSKSKQWITPNIRKFLNILYVILIMGVIERMYYFNWDTYKLLQESYGVLVNLTFISLALYIIRLNDTALLRAVIYIILFTFCFEAYTTYKGCLIYPLASRDMATGTSELAELYRKMNIGGFSFIYTLTLIHPLIPLLMKQKLMPWYIAIPISVLWGLCILESRYTTALLLFTISCLIYFFPKEFGVKQIKKVIFIVIILIPFLIYLPDFLLYVAHSDLLAGYQDIRVRLGDLGYMLTGSSNSMDSVNDIEGRSKLMDLSLKTFLENPFGIVLLGTGKVGGHSKILDTTAYWGIFGIAAMIIYYILLYRTFFKTDKYKPYHYYLLYAFVMCVVLSFLNPDWWLVAICFCYPIFISYIEKLKFK